jgi:uncharacterized membrane protein YheB (UPF0754 family)
MTVWIFYREIWVLPVAGFLVGYLTNYFALKIIFEPVERTRVCGCCWLQGLFLKRQREVAVTYGEIVSRKVVSSDRIINTLMAGPSSPAVFHMVRRQMEAAIDDYAGSGRVLVQLALGTEQYRAIKLQFAERMMDSMPALLLKVRRRNGRALAVLSLSCFGFLMPLSHMPTSFRLRTTRRRSWMLKPCCARE